MSDKPTSARRHVAEALIRVESGGYSNLLIDAMLSESGLSDRDRAFASRLYWGVIERRMTLDYRLGLHLSKPISSLDKEVLTALRIGAFELSYMDAVPDSAAVSQAVGLVRKLGKSSAAGLANAVLRSLAKGKGRDKLPDQAADGDFYDSIRLSCDRSIVELWRRHYDGRAMGMLERSFERPPKFIRVNPLKTDEDSLIRRLEAEGITAERHPSVPGCVVVMDGGTLPETESFWEGLYHVQDVSAQLAVMALGLGPHDRVIDVCAAPGGKSFTAAGMMGDTGEVIAMDVSENRLKAVQSGVRRLGLSSIRPMACDALAGDESLDGSADRVLCDVPCSGFGAIRRKPEIRYKRLSEMAELPALGRGILERSARYVKPGGTLVFSTCTLNPAENEEVAEGFLAAHPEFEENPLPEIFRPVAAENAHQVTLFGEYYNGDGFFIASFKRKES